MRNKTFKMAAAALLAFSAFGSSHTAQAQSGQWVTGYYGGYFWNNSDYQAPQHVDMRAMTHFVFARIGPGGGKFGGQPGEVLLGASDAQTSKKIGPGAPYRTVEQYLVDRAHHVGTKAIIMLGGEGDNAGFSASTEPGVRATFVKNLVDFMVSRDYDGIDVDWEGINSSDTESQARLEQLIADLRAEANARPRYQDRPVIITFPAGTLNPNYQAASAHEVRVAGLVDQFNIMSYGMAWFGEGWDTTTFAPLTGRTGSRPTDIASSIKLYVDAGIPRSKIGMGIGFYGLAYKPPFTHPGQPTAGYDFNSFSVNDVTWNYAQLAKHGYLSNGIYGFEASSQMGYRTYPGGGYTPTTRNTGATGYVSYEDETSIAAKGAWSQSTREGEGAGGTIIWLVNYGTTNGVNNPLLFAVKKAFLDPNATDPGPNPDPLPPPPPPQLSTTLNVSNDWGSGYCASLVVKNTGGYPGEWKVALPFTDSVNSLWGGVYTVAEEKLNVSGAEWNKYIDPQETREVGFCATRKAAPPPNEPPPPAGSITGTVVISNDWTSGYCANVVVANASSSKAVNWTVTVPVAGTVTSHWSGKIVQNGASIQVSGPDWNKDLAANSSNRDVGFCATR